MKTYQRVVKSTLAALNETLHDDSRIHKMLVAGQICDVSLKVDAAIREAVYLAKIHTRTSAAITGVAIAVSDVTCGTLLASRILASFGYDYINADVLKQIMVDSVWGNKRANATNLLVTLGAAAGIVFVPAWPAVLAFHASTVTTNVARAARMILMAAADIILTLELAFWYRWRKNSDSAISAEDIRLASVEFQTKVNDVHEHLEAEIAMTSIYQLLRFPDTMRQTLAHIVQTHLLKSDDRTLSPDSEILETECSFMANRVPSVS